MPTSIISAFYKTISLGKTRNLILIAMIVGIAFSVFVERRPHKNNPMSPANAWHLVSMSSAISELKYGLGGYLGYRKVYDLFYPSLERGDLGAINSEINQTIAQSLQIQDVSSAGTHYVLGASIGLVDFYKWSFRLFGYNVESTFYMYALLYTVPLLVFIVTFYDRLLYLFILLLLVCSFQVMSRSPMVMLEGLTHMRFFQMLTIIPAFYLALLVAGGPKLTLGLFAGAFVQTVFLLFSIYARTPGQYQLMFLPALPIVLIFLNWLRKAPPFQNIRFWPVILVFFIVFSHQTYMRMTIEPVYFTAVSKHAIWPPIYQGFSAHPDAEKKYGMDSFNDMVPIRAALRVETENGRPFSVATFTRNLVYGIIPTTGELNFLSDRYEQILKKEVFKILRDDPRFVWEGILVKLDLWLKCFWGPGVAPVGSLDAGVNLFKWYLIAVLLGGVILARDVLEKQWFPYFCLLVLNYLFSMIPSIITMPLAHSMQDSGLLFGVIIYLMFAVVLCHIFKMVKKIFELLFLKEQKSS